MIRRTTDDSIFSDSVLNNIANTVKKQDSRKLYRVCSTQEDALIAIKELKLSGYNYDIVEQNNKCLLYSIQPESIDLREANESGQFKKLAWGRYSFQKVSEIGDFQKYNFDDGSIWKVITGQDGKQYLVKEVDDEDEDKVIRVKLAKLQKRAELNINNDNVNSIVNILFSDKNLFFDEIIKDQNLGSLILEFVKNRFLSIINDKLVAMNITDESIKNSVIDHVSNKVISGEINNIDSINFEIETFLNGLSNNT